jgi:hypothetical protein
MQHPQRHTTIHTRLTHGSSRERDRDRQREKRERRGTHPPHPSDPRTRLLTTSSHVTYQTTQTHSFIMYTVLHRIGNIYVSYIYDLLLLVDTFYHYNTYSVLVCFIRPSVLVLSVSRFLEARGSPDECTSPGEGERAVVGPSVGRRWASVGRRWAGEGKS